MNTKDRPRGPLEPVVRFTVTEAAMRPASSSPQCFYCQQAIGAEHKPTCVMINKKVKVRMTVEYEIEVPASWDQEQIEFHRNEGSWCSNNALAELEALFGDEGGQCMCDSTRFEYLGHESPAYLDE